MLTTGFKQYAMKTAYERELERIELDWKQAQYVKTRPYKRPIDRPKVYDYERDNYPCTYHPAKP